MKFKKILKAAVASVLTAVMLFSLAFVGSAIYRSGTFSGSGHGKYSNVVLNVTIDDGKITAIDVVSQNETPHFWNKATAMFDRIISANSTDVDVVTGATKSSNAIKTAVNEALSKSELTEEKMPDFIKDFTISFMKQIIKMYNWLLQNASAA